MILAGDVGGTKTRLALHLREGGLLKRTVVERFESRSVGKFQDLVNNFLKSHNAKVEAACFGVPGPVIEGRAKTTNLPWVLSEQELSRDTGIQKIRLVNDLLATAAAIPHFKSEDIETLHAAGAVVKGGMAVVLAPGTGLGQAFISFANGKPIPSASEGGHADFAPNNELEMQLLSHLMKKFPHVSYERVLCGSGLVNIYNFLKDTNFAKESESIAARLASEDPAAVISINGLEGKDPLSSKALEMFCAIMGAQAGNLVLTLMATGGVYLGGGIPPKILPALKNGPLVKAYLQKGRLSDVVKSTAVHVIKDDHAAVLGAAHLAAEL